MSNRYDFLFRNREARWHLIAAFFSALPIAMISLAVVLTSQDWGLPASATGILTALFSVGNAVGLVGQARLIDLLSPRIVIGLAGPGCLLSLAGFLVAGYVNASLAVMGLLTASAGLFLPAITAAVRAWLPTVLPDAGQRLTAYAVLSILFQSALAIGPLVVSLVVVVSFPWVAVLAAGAFSLVAALVFALRSPQSVEPPTKGAAPSPSRSYLGPSAILAAAAASGLATGVLQLAVPALAKEHGDPAFSGVDFASLAIGEGLGALALGARAWAGPRSVQLAMSLVGVSAVYAGATAISGEAIALTLSLFLAGVLIAPIAILTSDLLDSVRPSGAALARDYGLLACVSVAAIAVGSFLAGLLSEHLSPPQLFWVPSGALLCAAGFVLLARKRLQ